MTDNESASFPPTISDVPWVAQKSPEQKREFFDRFLTLYRPAFMSFLKKVMRFDHDVAEDLVQGFILDRILSEKVFVLANGKGRFRNVLRTCLRHYCIDYLRKKKPIVDDRILEILDQPNGDVGDLDIECEMDIPWAIAVFREALEIMKNESDSWKLFEARVLVDPPVSYDELLKKYDFESPVQASNRLMTAKRQFNRIIEKVLTEQQIDDHVDSEAIQRELFFLKQQLAKSEMLTRVVDDIRLNSDSSFGSGTTFLIPSLQLLDERDAGFDSADDLQRIIEHILSINVGYFLDEEADGLPDTVQRCTFADVLKAETPDFETLFVIKEHFNTKAKGKDRVLPSKVNALMTYLYIAKSATCYPDRFDGITGMRKDKADKGMQYFLDQEWVPRQFKSLLCDAQKRLRS